MARGRALTEEAEAARCAKISLALTGKSPSVATRQKIRAASKRQFSDRKARERHAEITRRYWATPGYRERLVAAHNGKKLTPEHRAKIGVAHRGMKRPTETGQRISEAAKKRWSSYAPEHRSVITERMVRASRVSQAQRPSSIEIIVKQILDGLGVSYEQNAQIGRYFPDFLLRERSLIIECDGDYWHSRPAQIIHDLKRDRCLEAQGYTVIRLGETEIKSNALSLVRVALEGMEI